MSVKSLKYDVVSLYVGNLAYSGQIIPTGDIRQLQGVQSTDLSFNIPSQQVKGLGVLNTINSPNSAPTVSFGVEYLFGDARNESILGMVTDGKYGSFIGVHTGQKNFYAALRSFAGIPGDMVLSIGNGVLTNYSIAANIGSPIRASVNIEGFNLNLQSGTINNTVPNVEPSTGKEVSGSYSLAPYFDGSIDKYPGDLGSKLFTLPSQISLRLQSGEFFGLPSDVPINSFNLNVPLARRPTQRIGDKYAFERALECPIEAKLTISAIITGLTPGKGLQSQNFNFNNFEIITRECCDSIGKNWREDCNEKVKISINGAKLNGQSLDIQVGSANSMVNLEYDIYISNLASFKKNIIISGSHGKWNNYLYNYEVQNTGITPSGQFQLLSPEPFLNNTGYFIETYNPTYNSSIPSFSLDFSGNFFIKSGDMPSYFTGFSSGVLNRSGVLNSGLISRIPEFQNISTSLANPFLSNKDDKMYYFAGFSMPATTGFLTTGSLPGLFPEEQAITETKFISPKTYDFVVRGEDLYSGDISLKYYSNYPISITFATGVSVTPAKPFSLNRMTASFPVNNQADVGKVFDVYFVLNNSGNVTRTYRTNWLIT